MSIASDCDDYFALRKQPGRFHLFSAGQHRPTGRGCSSWKNAIREHLGEYIYAADGASLGVVVKQLQARGGSLVLVEVGSGGRLSAALSGVEGIGRLLAGAYTAPTEESDGPAASASS